MILPLLENSAEKCNFFFDFLEYGKNSKFPFENNVEKTCLKAAYFTYERFTSTQNYALPYLNKFGILKKGWIISISSLENISLGSRLIIHFKVLQKITRYALKNDIYSQVNHLKKSEIVFFYVRLFLLVLGARLQIWSKRY